MLLTWADVEAFFNHPQLLTRATGGARRWTYEEMHFAPRVPELYNQWDVADPMEVNLTFQKILVWVKTEQVVGWYASFELFTPHYARVHAWLVRKRAMILLLKFEMRAPYAARSEVLKKLYQEFCSDEK